MPPMIGRQSRIGVRMTDKYKYIALYDFLSAPSTVVSPFTIAEACHADNGIRQIWHESPDCGRRTW